MRAIREPGEGEGYGSRLETGHGPPSWAKHRVSSVPGRGERTGHRAGAALRQGGTKPGAEAAVPSAEGIPEPRHAVRAGGGRWGALLRVTALLSPTAGGGRGRPRAAHPELRQEGDPGCMAQKSRSCPSALPLGISKEIPQLSHRTAEAMRKQRASGLCTLQIMKLGGASCWHAGLPAAGEVRSFKKWLWDCLVDLRL